MNDITKQFWTRDVLKTLVQCVEMYCILFTTQKNKKNCAYIQRIYIYIYIYTGIYSYIYQGGPKVIGPFSLGYNFTSFNHTKPKF